MSMSDGCSATGHLIGPTIIRLCRQNENVALTFLHTSSVSGHLEINNTKQLCVPSLFPRKQQHRSTSSLSVKRLRSLCKEARVYVNMRLSLEEAVRGGVMYVFRSCGGLVSASWLGPDVRSSWQRLLVFANLLCSSPCQPSVWRRGLSMPSQQMISPRSALQIPRSCLCFFVKMHHVGLEHNRKATLGWAARICNRRLLSWCLKSGQWLLFDLT